MVSCLHSLYDDRIYWKEALSLKKHGFNVIHVGVGDENSDTISEHGIRLVCVKRKRYFLNPIIDKLFRTLTLRPNIYKQLYLLLKKIDASVYHLHDLQLNKIGVKLKRSSHRIKIVYDVHEPYPEIQEHLHRHNFLLGILKKQYGRYLRNWQYKCAYYYDLIIPTEENVAKGFKSNIPNVPVEIIYNYCNLNPKAPDSKENIEYDAIYCGGISSFRGVWTILETARIAKEKALDIKVLLLGTVKEPGLKKKCADYIEKYNLISHVVFKNHVPFLQVADFYNKSRCGLVIFEDNPVYRLIWPIKTFEYMCFGLPTITCNFGHTHELTRNHNTGTSITPGSAPELLDALLAYKTKQVLLTEHGTNAVNAYLKVYNWGIMEDKLIGVYKSTLDLSIEEK